MIMYDNAEDDENVEDDDDEEEEEEKEDNVEDEDDDVKWEEDDDVENEMLMNRKMMLRMMAWRRRTHPKTPTHSLREPAQSKCTWTSQKSHFMQEFAEKGRWCVVLAVALA